MLRRFMMLRLTFMVGMMALAACRSGSQGEGASAANAATNAAPGTNLDIATLLYNGVPRTPGGFLTDPAPESYAQVTTYHIQSTHLAPNATTRFELCTDDWAEALDWSESVAIASPVYLDLVTNGETERYYEFDRVPRDDPTHYVRMRVYRCDYLDRNGVSLDANSGFAGTLNSRPVNATVLGELAEYLWHFTIYNNADHAVLASEPVESSSGLIHVLTLAFLERDGGAGTCDRVYIEELRLTADELSGDLTQTVTPLRSFDVRRIGEAVLDCV